MGGCLNHSSRQPDGCYLVLPHNPQKRRIASATPCCLSSICRRSSSCKRALPCCRPAACAPRMQRRVRCGCCLAAPTCTQHVVCLHQCDSTGCFIHAAAVSWRCGQSGAVCWPDACCCAKQLLPPAGQPPCERASHSTTRPHTYRTHPVMLQNIILLNLLDACFGCLAW